MRSISISTRGGIIFRFALIALLLICWGCSDKVIDGGPDQVPEYTNLQLVAKGVPFTYHDDGPSANFPLWAPDGKTVYFMNILGNWWEEYTYKRKQIRRITEIGGESEVLFEDNYLFLTLSDDGTTFASTIDNSVGRTYPGGNPLVLIDIASGAVDTLVFDTSIRCSTPPRLSPSGDSLFFYGTYVDSTDGTYETGWLWGSFFVYDLSSGTYEKLFDENPYLVAGFDLYNGGSQIISAGKIRNLDGTVVVNLKNVGMWQRIAPDGQSIVGAFGYDFQHGNRVNLVKVPDDRLLDSLDLNDELIYSEFDISPDGLRILMSVSFQLPLGGFFLSSSQIYMYDLSSD